jgi:putative ABC transport system permease protein
MNRTFAPLPSVDSIWQDFRYAARTLRRQPGFALASVLLLASVTGFNTSLLAMIDALALHPPAGIANPSQVAAIYPIVPPGEPPSLTAAEFRYLADHARTIDIVGATDGPKVTLGPIGDQGTTPTLIVRGDFFRTLGLTMIDGRGFERDDDRPDTPRAVGVIGAGLWETRFGADPSVVGRAIAVNNLPVTVIGIVSREFVGFDPAVQGRPGIFFPVAAMPLLNPSLKSGSAFIGNVAGRMARGSTRAAVRAEADALLNQFHAEESRAFGLACASRSKARRLASMSTEPFSTA